MPIPRQLEPEWLDEMDPADPRAQRSRRDLRRVNALMRNASLIAQALVQNSPAAPPRVMVDLGSGDGHLMLRVARRLAPVWKDVKVILLDRQGVPDESVRAGFESIGWQMESVSADVFEWLNSSSQRNIDVILSNLFLHHFPETALAELLALTARRSRMLVACEPRRSRFGLTGSYLLGLIGCNDVTRHDAVVSVRAGFNGQELSGLWPVGDGWRLAESVAGMFSHRFVACRPGE
jgi:hypothetical protein